MKCLNRHLKEAHDGAAQPVEKTEIKDNITCKMCNKAILRDQIKKHLFRVHKVKKTGDEKGTFRGWLSFDDITWTPLFLERGEVEPPSELTVAVPVKGGIINLYGLDYKITEVENKSPNVVLSKVKSHSDMVLKTSTVVPKINLEKNREQTDLAETLHEKKNQSNGSVINVESHNIEETSVLLTVVEDPMSSDVSTI